MQTHTETRNPQQMSWLHCVVKKIYLSLFFLSFIQTTCKSTVYNESCLSSHLTGWQSCLAGVQHTFLLCFDCCMVWQHKQKSPWTWTVLMMMTDKDDDQGDDDVWQWWFYVKCCQVVIILVLFICSIAKRLFNGFKWNCVDRVLYASYDEEFAIIIFSLSVEWKYVAQCSNETAIVDISIAVRLTPKLTSPFHISLVLLNLNLQY